MNNSSSLLNNLQLYRGKRFADLVDENMIANAMLTKPHEVAGLLSLVFGTKDDGISTTIDLLTGGLGSTMTIENRVYEWSVMIDADHAVNIRYAKWNGKEITPKSITEGLTPGINNTPIYLGLEEKWFGPGAILAFDNVNFQVRVMVLHTRMVAHGYMSAMQQKASRVLIFLASICSQVVRQTVSVLLTRSTVMRQILSTIRLHLRCVIA